MSTQHPLEVPESTTGLPPPSNLFITPPFLFLQHILQLLNSLPVSRPSLCRFGNRSISRPGPYRSLGASAFDSPVSDALSGYSSRIEVSLFVSPVVHSFLVRGIAACRRQGIFASARAVRIYNGARERGRDRGIDQTRSQVVFR